MKTGLKTNLLKTIYIKDFKVINQNRNKGDFKLHKYSGKYLKFRFLTYSCLLKIIFNINSVVN